MEGGVVSEQPIVFGLRALQQPLIRISGRESTKNRVF